MASSFPIQIAAKHSGYDVQYYPVTAGQTFVANELVTLTTGALVVCGADPALILGIALAPASVGLATAGSIYGGTNIPVAIISPNLELFMASATTPVQATHEMVNYGIEKTGNNWRVDTTDTTNLRVVVVKCINIPQQEGFLVRFTATNLQGDAIAS